MPIKSFFNLINQLTNSVQIQKDPRLEHNIKYKNIHADKRCFIIGNGSSLKKQNLSPLSKEITFVMNAFWKHPIISSKWQPTYYCFADPLYFDGSVAWLDFFTKLKKKIKKSIFFVPAFAKEIIIKQNILPIRKTNYVSFDSSITDKKELELAGYIPSVESTSQLALTAAIYMGCNPIYLLGLDHDWLAHRGCDKHFYSEEVIKNHPKVESELSKYSYKSILESCLRLWNRYEYLKDIASARGIKIFNATDEGFLDVFERKKYEEIFTDT